MSYLQGVNLESADFAKCKHSRLPEEVMIYSLSGNLLQNEF
jgi:hypothetical protein